MLAVLLATQFLLAWAQDGMPDMGGMGAGMPDMSSMMGGGGGGAGGMGGMDLSSMMGGMGGGMGGMGGMGDGGPPPDPFPAVKSDIKFISCSTCKTLARRLHLQMSKWGKEITGSEEALQGKLSEMCDPKSEAGSWITEYDMVESKDGRAIDLKRQSSQGECEVECNTVSEACKAVLQESEIDLAAGLYKSFKSKKPLDAKALTSRLCTSDDAWAANVEGSCPAGVPKVPKKRKAGAAFKPKGSTQAAPMGNSPGVSSEL